MSAIPENKRIVEEEKTFLFFSDICNSLNYPYLYPQKLIYALISIEMYTVYVHIIYSTTLTNTFKKGERKIPFSYKIFLFPV